MSDTYHFQVNLGGMLDILSNHLYKTADVFLRELMQNSVDAITLRRKLETAWKDGEIHISLIPGRKIVFTDNGAGLTKDEIHQFLSVIGQSSKHDTQFGQSPWNAEQNLEPAIRDRELPEGYIGRFGIGLLSCFMVSDTIVVHTKSIKSDQAYQWVGASNGTYTLSDIYPEDPCMEDCPGLALSGTSIILTAKAGCESYFQPETMERLVAYYGLMLPVPIYLNDYPEPLNQIPDNFTLLSRNKLLSFGEWLFEEEFLEAIPIHTEHIFGCAYVVNYTTSSTVKNGHRIYLKHMLLTDEGNPLLPEWAFFLRCFLNTSGLRPTASRESFYEDSELALARQEFAEAVKQHFMRLSNYNPKMLQNIVGIHNIAIKSIAVWDDEMFDLFIDFLSFTTSEGELTGLALKQIGSAVYIHDLSRYKQLKPIFLAQNRLLICSGYIYDAELIAKLSKVFGLPIFPLHEEDMQGVLEEISEEDNSTLLHTLGLLNESLKAFDCRADLKYFYPVDLPALYYMSDDVQFIRQVQGVKENTKGVFSEALSSLLSGAMEKPLSILYLNYHNPLVKRLMHIQNPKLVNSIIQILYIQALATGGHSLHHGELKALSKELTYLVDHCE